LLATGSRAAGLPVPGAELPHVRTLRSLADCRLLLEAVEGARDVVVVGAGFIGMEAAAALRERELGVTVVAPDVVPFERALGAELGRRVQRLQEDHGVGLRLGRTLSAIEPGRVVLDDGSPLRADVVLVAVGARPETELAERRGIRVDDGIVVDGGMATSVDGIWAAGDIARFPHPRTGEPIRVEHWVVALHQGEVAARGMLGLPARYDAPPFFWTQLYDVSVTYSGHAGAWDEIGVDGDLERGEALIRYLRAGETMAVAAVGRELASLEAEAELQRRWGHRPAGGEGTR
ncbi:MAG TPA: FAD-dependent oxidoreductase, partial [Longimicrobiales bacterium]|nr:FAD-dependent oxidoreductase [Longimicrobiales bacterium]